MTRKIIQLDSSKLEVLDFENKQNCKNPMVQLSRLILFTSMPLFILGCEHGATTTSANEPVVEAMVESEAVAESGSATVTISKKPTGELYFSEASGGWSAPGRSGSWITKKTDGSIDLSSFPPGDVKIWATLDLDLWNAGYRYSTDPYQVVAAAVWQVGSSTPPSPVFGAEHWPGEFEAPYLSTDQRTITFVDHDDDALIYEYSIAVIAPGGEPIVLDPKITNKGDNR